MAPRLLLVFCEICWIKGGLKTWKHAAFFGGGGSAAELVIL